MQNQDWRLEFPEVTDVDIEFGGYPDDWFDEMLNKYDGFFESREDERKYEDVFSHVFFNNDPSKVILNGNLGDDYIKRGGRLFRAIAGSFTPKHEDKEKVCAMILKSMCE